MRQIINEKRIVSYLFTMLILVLIAAGCAADNEGQPGTDSHTEADLVFRLEDEGAQVRLSTEPVPALDILAIPGNIIFVNGEELQVYVYDTAEAASAAAAEISTETMDVDGQPHFYQWDNILILYLGENEELLTLLNETIGEPFAG
jgi:hypothetical protein